MKNIPTLAAIAFVLAISIFAGMPFATRRTAKDLGIGDSQQPEVPEPVSPEYLFEAEWITDENVEVVFLEDGSGSIKASSASNPILFEWRALPVQDVFQGTVTFRFLPDLAEKPVTAEYFHHDDILNLTFEHLTAFHRTKRVVALYQQIE